jgi:integrase
MGTIKKRERKDGTSFYAEVRRKGEKPQRATFRTLREAKQWIQTTEAAIVEGRHFGTSNARRYTVEDLIQRYIEEVLPLHPQRAAKYTAMLSWWQKHCGHLYLSNFTPEVIARGRKQLLSENTYRGTTRSPATVNRYLCALGAACTHAVREWGWLHDNPLGRVSKLPEPQGRDRLLSPDEMAHFLEACQESTNPLLYPFVVVAFVTGMRSGEITSLCWKDVDFTRRMITLNRTKNGDVRKVPFSDEVEAVFRLLPSFEKGPDTLLFGSLRTLRKEATPASMRTSFEKASRDAGIQNFRIHDLRHQAASYMAMGGATQGELMAILGHRSPRMTARYAHYSQEHLRGVVQKNQLPKSTLKKLIPDDRS